ncbi:MAG: hypothetical protein ACKVVP_15805 [Chloroflexota bacterium]
MTVNALASAESAPGPLFPRPRLPNQSSSSPRLCHVTLWLLVPMFLLAATRYFFAPTDLDYWWHLKTGQLMLETSSLPRADVFSYTSLGQPWVPHEWLTQLIYALTVRHFGFAGLAALWAMLGAGLWCTVYCTARARGLGEPAAIILVMWAAAMAFSVTSVRPQVLTALLLAATALLITRYKAGHARALWPLPVIFMFWVNLHGGYVIGLVLLGLTVVGETCALVLGQKAAPLKSLLLVSVLSGLATLISPNGLDALWYPFTYAGTGNGSMRHIAEWQSPNFHDPSFLIFGASVLLALALGLARKPLGPTEVLWSLLFSLMALTSLRHIPLYAIVVTPLIAGRIAAELPWLAMPLSAWRRPALMAVAWPMLLAGIVVQVHQSQPTGGPQLHAMALDPQYPRGAVEFLQGAGPETRIFNEYHWGGYLIDRLPQVPVFIDGRADVHGDRLIDQYVRVTRLLPGWREVLEDFGVNLILTEKGNPLDTTLAVDARWDAVFTGTVERVYARRSGALPGTLE